MKQAEENHCPHRENYALVDADPNQGIVVLGGHEGVTPIVCVALRPNIAAMFAMTAEMSKEHLLPGKQLLLVRFTNPEIIDIISSPVTKGEKK